MRHYCISSLQSTVDGGTAFIIIQKTDRGVNSSQSVFTGYKAFHGFGQAIFAYGGSILGSRQSTPPAAS